MRHEEYRAMYDLEDRLWWYEGMRAITASILDRGLTKREGLRLLDVGCGTGYSITWLKRRLKAEGAFGLDLSLTAAQFWRPREMDAGAVGSVSAIPFTSDQFDLVTCFDVVYQLGRTEARQAIAEMCRVLRPGGMLFIREPAYEWMRGGHDVAVGTRHRYTLGELRLLLQENGFEICRSTYANTLLFAVAAPHRWLSRIRGEGASDVKPAPRLMNTLFESVLKIEARLLRRVTLPFGLSVMALAVKRQI